MPNLFASFRRSGIFRALRHPVFATYITAHAVSVLGLWIQRIAIQWLVWSLSESYAWLGAMALAEALCATVFSIVGGPFADRFDRTKLASGTQTLLALVALGLAVVTYLDLMTLPLLMAFVMATGAIEGIWTPVRLALIPNMVPREDMPAAVAITALIFNLAIFIGPAIGAAIISLATVETAFVANAFSYVALVVVFLRIKLTSQVRNQRKASYGSDLLAGLAHVVNTINLRTLVVFSLVFSFCLRPFRELLAGVADEVLNMGAEGLGALASSAGFGAMVGAFFIASYGRTQALVNVLLVVSITAVAAQVAFAFAEELWIAMFCVGALSGCVTVFGTAAQMLVQMSVEDDIRGRVMSLWQAQFRGVPTFAAWLMGMMEPYFGLQTIFIAAGALFLVLMVVNIRHRNKLVDFG